MIVEIFVKGAEIKLVKVAGEFLVDENIADPFADEGAVFSFDEGVVVGMARTGFGELN